jgi:hypothetical protein
MNKKHCRIQKIKEYNMNMDVKQTSLIELDDIWVLLQFKLLEHSLCPSTIPAKVEYLEFLLSARVKSVGCR